MLPETLQQILPLAAAGEVAVAVAAPRVVEQRAEVYRHGIGDALIGGGHQAQPAPRRFLLAQPLEQVSPVR